MSLSNTFETHILQYLFKTDSLTRPTQYHLALYTAAPNDAGGGTEVSGNGYTRKTVAWTVSGNTATNTSAIEFPACTGSAWGTITHIGVHTASSGGDLIIHSALAVSKVVAVGDVMRVNAGQLSLSLD
jgi:hypothetical protein